MNKKMMMLIRLETLAKLSNDLIPFLIEEKLITEHEGKMLYFVTDPEQKARDLLVILNKVAEVAQLVHYEWQLLPREKAQLSIVTDRTKRDFEWEEQ